VAVAEVVGIGGNHHTNFAGCQRGLNESVRRDDRPRTPADYGQSRIKVQMATGKRPFAV
jgi:hypothetical protein